MPILYLLLPMAQSLQLKPQEPIRSRLIKVEIMQNSTSPREQITPSYTLTPTQVSRHHIIELSQLPTH